MLCYFSLLLWGSVGLDLWGRYDHQRARESAGDDSPPGLTETLKEWS